MVTIFGANWQKLSYPTFILCAGTEGMIAKRMRALTPPIALLQHKVARPLREHSCFHDPPPQRTMFEGMLTVVPDSDG